MCSSYLIASTLILKKPKHRQENRKFNWHWKEFVQEQWPCNKSDELKYAATLLFQQVKALGVPAYSCGYNIWEKDEKEFTSWMSTQDGSDINGVPNIPLTEDANFIRYVESKQKWRTIFCFGTAWRKNAGALSIS